MRIGFTGHRDRFADERELDILREDHPGAVWVHGGAPGFDTQVDDYAKAHGIDRDVKRPNYKDPAVDPKRAPLLRNREIVDSVELLVACYDGQQTGGTAYTVRYAHEKGVELWILPPRT